MGSIDSGYLNLAAKTDILNYTHPDFAATWLLTRYLGESDGPIWEAVRGPGFVYEAQLSLDVDTGLIEAALSRGSYIVEAFNATKAILVRIIGRSFCLKQSNVFLFFIVLVIIIITIICGNSFDKLIVEIVKLDAFLVRTTESDNSYFGLSWLSHFLLK